MGKLPVALRHHSLIRWSLVIHGCIDGFSRRIIFLHCSANNLASTVLNLFHSAIETDGGIWPSRIRVDYGVENVLVCEEMVENRGAGREVSLLVHQHITRESSGFGGMCFDVSVTITIMYFMVWKIQEFLTPAILFTCSPYISYFSQESI
jgi:hypothetical protein